MAVPILPAGVGAHGAQDGHGHPPVQLQAREEGVVIVFAPFFVGAAARTFRSWALGSRVLSLRH